MTISTKITSGTGDNYKVKVSRRGQLITAPLEFSEAYAETLDVINTAYNIVKPITGKKFVVTALVASGNKNIGPDGAFVEIYEANSDDTLVSEKLIFSFQLDKNGTLPVTPLNLILNEGKWLNATTDDDDILLTITGYYIEA